MNELIGKEVIFSITQWGKKGPEPSLFEGTVNKVEGSMVHIVATSYFGEPVLATWYNTASNLFNWMQVKE